MFPGNKRAAVSATGNNLRGLPDAMETPQGNASAALDKAAQSFMMI